MEFCWTLDEASVSSRVLSRDSSQLAEVIVVNSDGLRGQALDRVLESWKIRSFQASGMLQKLLWDVW